MACVSLVVDEAEFLKVKSVATSLECDRGWCTTEIKQFQEEQSMKRSIYHRLALGLSAMTAIAGLAVSEAFADANEEGEVALVCYKWSEASPFGNERLRLSVRKPAPVNETDPAQQTWGTTGRHVNVCGEGTASVVRGVIVADEPAGSSRMGLQSIVVRGDGDQDLCRTVTWDCTASEPVRTPHEWACEGRNEFGESLGFAVLEKMTNEVIATDSACQFFEVGMSVSDVDLTTGTYGN